MAYTVGTTLIGLRSALVQWAHAYKKNSTSTFRFRAKQFGKRTLASSGACPPWERPGAYSPTSLKSAFTWISKPRDYLRYSTWSQWWGCMMDASTRHSLRATTYVTSQLNCATIRWWSR